MRNLSIKFMFLSNFIELPLMSTFSLLMFFTLPLLLIIA